VFDFSSPTPVSSLLSGLIAILLLVAVGALVRLVRARRGNKQGSLDALVNGVRVFDRSIVHAGSWIVGTRCDNPATRRLLVTTVFLGSAVVGTFSPWPWGLAAIAFGVLAIFIVFRHWSRDEHEALLELPRDQKDIKIRGDLAAEVMIACASLLVFAPVAFAQLQAHGYGFELSPNSGPFTFLFYTLIETLKAGWLVAYYDLFADRLGFDQLTPVTNPSIYAKWVVLGYRLALSLLILATFKRLFDIARRRAEGLDLRHIEQTLLGQDSSAQEKAIEQLKAFALAGRGSAPLLLERIVNPWQSDAWRGFAPEVRFAAAEALHAYGKRRGGRGALHESIKAYQRIIEQDWRRDPMPKQWAKAQEHLANAWQCLGTRESGTQEFETSVALFRAALEVRGQLGKDDDWADAQNYFGSALYHLGERKNEMRQREVATKLLREAADAFRASFDVWTKNAMNEQRAVSQQNLGAVLRYLGAWERDPVILDEAIVAMRAALEIRTRRDNAPGWAMTQNNIGAVLMSIAALERGKKSMQRIEEAIEVFRTALKVRTPNRLRTEWAITQGQLGSALHQLGERYYEQGEYENGTKLLKEGIEASQAALEVFTRGAMPRDWAKTQDVIAEAQFLIGEHEKDQPRLEAARMASAGSLEVNPDEEHRDTLARIERTISMARQSGRGRRGDQDESGNRTRT